MESRLFAHGQGRTVLEDAVPTSRHPGDESPKRVGCGARSSHVEVARRAARQEGHLRQPNPAPAPLSPAEPRPGLTSSSSPAPGQACPARPQFQAESLHRPISSPGLSAASFVQSSPALACPGLTALVIHGIPARPPRRGQAAAAWPAPGLAGTELRALPAPAAALPPALPRPSPARPGTEPKFQPEPCPPQHQHLAPAPALPGHGVDPLFTYPSPRPAPTQARRPRSVLARLRGYSLAS